MTDREQDEVYLEALRRWELGETQRSIVADMGCVTARRLADIVRQMRLEDLRRG